MTLSLRARLVVWVVGGMAVLQVGLAALVYEEIERSLRHSFNRVLSTQATTLSGAVEQDAQGIKVDVDERELPEFGRGRRPDYFQLWSRTGAVIARSSSLGGADLPKPDVARGAIAFRSIDLPGGRKGRAAVLTFMPKLDDAGAGVSPSGPVTLVVARDTEPLEDEMSALTWLLSAGTGGTILLSLALAALIVRHGLRPLDAVAARIAAIRQDDLFARIPADRLPAELAPVVGRLNDLLGRLEGAFARERAFTADVAHELRTPLAGLRSTIEVALARPRKGAEYQEALDDCLGIVRRAQALSDQLLALARMEGRQTAVAREVVRLAPVVDSACRPLVEAADRRGLSLAIAVPPDCACTADGGLLLTALSELAANAAEYAGAGGRVSVSARSTAAGTQVEFSNTGCSLRAEDAARVFDRFWRGDRSRSQTGVHCGLGLTLVQQSIQAMGGSIEAAIDEGVFSVRVTLLPAPNGVVR